MLFLGILFGFTFSSLPYFIKENNKISEEYFNNKKVKF